MFDRNLRIAFGQCVRNLRLRKGIAQEALALGAGIDRGYMGALERGKHSPSIEMIYRLLPPLEITFTQFATEFEKCLRRVFREEKKHGDDG